MSANVLRGARKKNTAEAAVSDGGNTFQRKLIWELVWPAPKKRSSSGGLGAPGGGGAVPPRHIKARRRGETGSRRERGRIGAAEALRDAEKMRVRRTRGGGGGEPEECDKNPRREYRSIHTSTAGTAHTRMENMNSIRRGFLCLLLLPLLDAAVRAEVERSARNCPPRRWRWMLGTGGGGVGEKR